MSKIIIGADSEGKPLRLDIDLLIPSRLLIQANSGGGKSWLLRRIAEQLHGHVQTIIIDPEGEFFTLREKFGYVLVGEGGETPADVRSAEMLATRFLELKVSAVCDLYEAFRSQPMQRRQWVRTFLNALIDAPRNLWHPLIVIVDEAHKFCPQESPKAASMQEREIIGGCKDAMVALSTTGRKRGFCPIWATQRLAKLDKDASAEFFNRLVGMTIEDVDVDRAADLMSVSKEEKHDFRQSLRQLSPGEFYAFGRAITIDRTLVKVGEVQTKHPESGKQAGKSAPPPTPDEVKKFLPQLSDLPKEAEQKVRTVAELEKQVRDLRAELKKTQKAAPIEKVVKTEEKIVEIPVVKDAQIAKLEALMEKASGMSRALTEAIMLAKKPAVTKPVLTRPTEKPVLAPRPMPARVAPASNGNATLSAAHVKVLSRLAELMKYTGSASVRKEQLAAWAEYSPNSGGFNNYLGSLRSTGLIDYPAGGWVTLTEEGRKHARPDSVPVNSAEMLQRAKRVLGGSEGRLLELLHDSRDVSTKAQLAEAAGFSPNSGGFNNYLGHMRTLGFVEYPQPGMVKASDWLYLD